MKLGILDVKVFLQDGTRINLEKHIIELRKTLNGNRRYCLISFSKGNWMWKQRQKPVESHQRNFTFHTAGIEFSMTALFLVVFVEQWKSVKNHTSAVAGAGVVVTTVIHYWKRNTIISIRPVSKKSFDGSLWVVYNSPY